jgi:hypothetical protein
MTIIRDAGKLLDLDPQEFLRLLNITSPETFGRYLADPKGAEADAGRVVDREIRAAPVEVDTDTERIYGHVMRDEKAERRSELPLEPGRR